jgi:glycosyltransferase involved in cell wall biosynthesis
MLRARGARFAVLVFVINEGERVRRQLAKMAPLRDVIDVVVADGGSTDGALEAPYPEECGVRAVLVKRGPGKLSAQMRMGLSWALREGYEGVVVVDGNDKDDTAAVREFVRALEAGYDHVQGSRYVEGGRAVNTPWLRHWGVKLLHAPLLSLASGRVWTDTTNGFRAYSRRFLLDAGVQPFREAFRTYELHYYLAIRAARLGFQCCELPVTREYPADGRVPTKISGWRGNLQILGLLLAACAGRYDPR